MLELAYEDSDALKPVFISVENGLSKKVVSRTPVMVRL